MNDFPCKIPIKITVEQALSILFFRYIFLESRISEILIKLEKRLHNIKDPDNPNLGANQTFWGFFYNLMVATHEFLFKDILSNAGQFRKIDDPLNGRIGFGGLDYREIGKFRYYGTNPAQIDNQILECFYLLKMHTQDPIKSSLEFYRRFVKIHPFYDANGRIARLILTIYNRYHRYHISWSELEKDLNKNRFIKLLNECHKRENQKIYNEYFERLLNFFKKFVISLNELEEN